MEIPVTRWSKAELQVYILLLCANADADLQEQELNVIRSKVDADCFERIYEEFLKDSEEVSFSKLERNIALHEYSWRELNQLKLDMKAVFASDRKYMMLEQNMERILNNMLY